jgi:outer membrane biosynthesis protein TonB
MGSLALHLAVAAAFLISWRHARDIKIGAVVPVTLVSDAPPAELSPAIQAPEAQTAQVDEPTPSAPLEAAAPAPQPALQPAASQPAPPKAAALTPKPQAKTPAKPEKSLDLDALAASVSKMAKPAAAKPSSAAKGASRPETAVQARTGAGSAAATAALSGLAEELQRRWNPNCAVADAREVVVAVTFTLNSGGGVSGEPRAQLAQGAQNAGARAAADRAVSAVYAAAPFRSLPREIYGQPIRVNFDAKKACS